MDTLHDVWREIADRPGGPFALRFYLQPLMATIFAVRDGLRDAHAERSPFLWTFYKDKSSRRGLAREAWKSVGKIFVIAVILDTVYQITVLRGLRPLEGLIVATLLAIVPYVLIRGPVARLGRRHHEAHSEHSPHSSQAS